METDPAETYDILTINWKHAQGDFSQNVRQEGTLTIFLAATNNATDGSQVGFTATGIVPVLDGYIVTEWGVGVAQVGKLT